MSGKMNWDRVRKENLVFKHGAEWISPMDSVVDSAGNVQSSSLAHGKPVKFAQNKIKPVPRSDSGRMAGGLHPKISAESQFAEWQSELSIAGYSLHINPYRIRVYRGGICLHKSEAKRAIRSLLGKYMSDVIISSLRLRTPEGIAIILKKFLPKHLTWRVAISNEGTPPARADNLGL
jgi:hypothetical protein